MKATCDDRTPGLLQRGIIVVDLAAPPPPRRSAIFSSRPRRHKITNVFYSPLGKTYVMIIIIIIHVETILLYRTKDIIRVLSNAAADHHTCTRNVLLLLLLPYGSRILYYSRRTILAVLDALYTIYPVQCIRVVCTGRFF